MSGDAGWRVGDLALCVRGMDWVPGGCGRRAPDECSPIKSMLAPTVGSVWTVDHVAVVWREEEGGCDFVYLGLQAQPSDICFDARFFTKVSDHEADLEDQRTIALLNGDLDRCPPLVGV